MSSSISILKQEEACRSEMDGTGAKPVFSMSKKLSKLHCQEGIADSYNTESEQWILQIDWRQKCLSSLPEYLQKYQFCTSLNLSGNNLEGGIDWLIHLKRLQLLDLSRNKFSKLTDVCGSVSTLEYLDLSHNQMRELPEWILLLEKVRNLNLSCNPLEKSFHVHLKKAKWKSIEVCKLENINLVSIPDCIQSACNLKELYLGNVNLNTFFHKSLFYGSNNTLWKIPELLPSSLSVLDLSNVQLSNFEYEWKHLPNLTELRAKGNDLFWPSENFTVLKKLETCDLSSCKMFLLPKDFGCLINLCFINLSFNKLTMLPKSFEQFHSLNHLDLYNAGIETIQCNLAKLSRLVKCDLWMNLVEPSEFLPNHTNLCSNLRGCLFLEEKQIRINERISPSVVSEDDGDGDRSEVETDEGINESREVTASSTGTGIEESWDDEVFSDYETDVTCPSDVDKQQGMIMTSSNGNDNHFFLPSQLHASSCSLQPSRFGTIQGQFDDVD